MNEKMKLYTGLVLLFFLLLAPSCGKRAIYVDAGFIGVWNGSDGVSTYHLSIDDHSEGYWDKQTNGHFESAQGVARVNNGYLHIGLKRFTINELPVADTSTGMWTMILDNVTYTR